MSENPMDTQVGGNHYKRLAIQPMELWIKNQLPGVEATAINHLTRHRDKLGRMDVEKARQYVESLIERMAASVGRIPYALIRNGKAFESDEHRHKIAPAISRIKSAPLYIDDRGALTVAQMRTTARRLHKREPLALIVVDYLQLARAKAENRVMEVTAISQGLKALAKELRVPLIALSQLNRGVEGRQDKRPNSGDLRDSGAIEQDADVIWMLYRDEVYCEESAYRGVAEVICSKQRNGPTGCWRPTCICADSTTRRPDGFRHQQQRSRRSGTGVSTDESQEPNERREHLAQIR